METPINNGVPSTQGLSPEKGDLGAEWWPISGLLLQCRAKFERDGQRDRWRQGQAAIFIHCTRRLRLSDPAIREARIVGTE